MYGLCVVSTKRLCGPWLLKASRLWRMSHCDDGNRFCSGSSTMLMNAVLLNRDDSTDSAARFCSSTAHQRFFHPRKRGEQLGHRAFTGPLVTDKNRHPLEVDPAAVVRQAGADGAKIFQEEAHGEFCSIEACAGQKTWCGPFMGTFGHTASGDPTPSPLHYGTDQSAAQDAVKEAQGAHLKRFPPTRFCL